MCASFMVVVRHADLQRLIKGGSNAFDERRGGFESVAARTPDA